MTCGDFIRSCVNTNQQNDISGVLVFDEDTTEISPIVGKSV
jgi:hypothetical protein